MATETQLYGVDIALENRDFIPDATGDLKIVTSRQNLADSITHRLVTEQSHLAYDSTYGVDIGAFVGEKALYSRMQLLRLEIMDSLQQDKRIARVDNVTVTQDTTRPDVLYVSITITPIDSPDPMNLNLIYPFYLNQAVVSVTNETQTSTSRLSVNTSYGIYSVKGVYLATDVSKIGVNFYTDGTRMGTFSGTQIVLAYELTDTNTDVIIDYDRKNTGGG